MPHRVGTAESHSFLQKKWVKRVVFSLFGTAVIVGLISLFTPGRAAGKKYPDPIVNRITVVLKGEMLSEPIYAAGASKVYYSGPPSAKVHFSDGTSGWIAEWHGKKPDPFRFSGPQGDTVLVDIIY